MWRLQERSNPITRNGILRALKYEARCMANLLGFGSMIQVKTKQHIDHEALEIKAKIKEETQRNDGTIDLTEDGNDTVDGSDTVDGNELQGTPSSKRESSAIAIWMQLKRPGLDFWPYSIIRQKEIDALMSGKWLSTEMIDFAAEAICQDLPVSALDLRSSTYIEKIASDKFTSDRFVKNLVPLKPVVIPAVVSAHFVLVVVLVTEAKKAIIFLLDSLPSSRGQSIINTLRIALNGFDIDVQTISVPKQVNGDDCGAHAIVNLHQFVAIVSGVPPCSLANCLQTENLTRHEIEPRQFMQHYVQRLPWRRAVRSEIYGWCACPTARSGVKYWPARKLNTAEIPFTKIKIPPTQRRKCIVVEWVRNVYKEESHFLAQEKDWCDIGTKEVTSDDELFSLAVNAMKQLHARANVCVL